ncbi:conserved hypothetical protein [Desulfamplus magnetovallimortis]|uniref:Uncharacterized protein n=1 Tax=Desulfamplus magnetovallimortis TaxID=1246637 RepID=A0A1W1HD34_9BACT|nr:radical SAM protein [Desulfamplus magnetovallimortis]SLM30411.1 conserved hypothetical protein [Desulfamplus magnetovallimortis]
MKIWILNPPYFKHFSRPQRSPAVTKSGTVYYPIWLAGCTGVLEEAGHDVTLTDAPARGYDLEYILEMSKELAPSLIVVDTSTPSINNDLTVCKRIREKLPHAFIVLVGTHASALPHETLLQCDAVNAVARKEYELTIDELAKYLCKSSWPLENGYIKNSHIEPLSSIKGLSFCALPENSTLMEPAIAEKNDNDYSTKPVILHNPDRPFIEDLDTLPWVSKIYQKHLCMEDYFNPNTLFPMATIMTSRGCPFRCSFCVYPQTITGRRFRFRSVEDVVDEMEYIQKNIPKIKAIFFEDDTMSANRKRCIALSREIIKRGIKLPWTTNSRIDPDLETLKIMKKAGCRSLCVGFESGEQRILNGMHKGTRKEKMFRFMKDAKKAGILIHGCFMVGFPGEGRSDIKKTIELSMKLKPDTVQFYPVMVYPGTEAYSEYMGKGWITAEKYENWLTPEGLHNCVVRNEALSSQKLVDICNDARREFYLRPRYIAYKLFQIIRHPSEATRTLKAFRTFFRHLGIFPKLDILSRFK